MSELADLQDLRDEDVHILTLGREDGYVNGAASNGRSEFRLTWTLWSREQLAGYGRDREGCRSGLPERAPRGSPHLDQRCRGQSVKIPSGLKARHNLNALEDRVRAQKMPFGDVGANDHSAP